MRILAFTVVLVFFCSPVSAGPTDAGAIEGSFFFAGKTVVDPPPSEAKNTHVYFQLTGQSALALYRELPVKSQPFICDGKSPSKTIGTTVCWIEESSSSARCTLGINLRTQAVDSGLPC
jgi:hypothetical protein